MYVYLNDSFPDIIKKKHKKDRLAGVSYIAGGGGRPGRCSGPGLGPPDWPGCHTGRAGSHCRGHRSPPEVTLTLPRGHDDRAQAHGRVGVVEAEGNYLNNQLTTERIKMWRQRYISYVLKTDGTGIRIFTLVRHLDILPTVSLWRTCEESGEYQCEPHCHDGL